MQFQKMTNDSINVNLQLIKNGRLKMNFSREAPTLIPYMFTSGSCLVLPQFSH